MIFWRKIVIFHTKYPKNVRASLRSAQFFYLFYLFLTRVIEHNRNKSQTFWFTQTFSNWKLIWTTCTTILWDQLTLATTILEYQYCHTSGTKIVYQYCKDRFLFQIKLKCLKWFYFVNCKQLQQFQVPKWQNGHFKGYQNS